MGAIKPLTRLFLEQREYPHGMVYVASDSVPDVAESERMAFGSVVLSAMFMGVPHILFGAPKMEGAIEVYRGVSLLPVELWGEAAIKLAPHSVCFTGSFLELNSDLNPMRFAEMLDFDLFAELIQREPFMLGIA